MRTRNLYILCLTLPYLLTPIAFNYLDMVAIGSVGLVMYSFVYIFLLCNAFQKSEEANKKLAWLSPFILLLMAIIILIYATLFACLIFSDLDFLSFLPVILAIMGYFILGVGYLYVALSQTLYCLAKHIGLTKSW